jgi:hypothetical protein
MFSYFKQLLNPSDTTASLRHAMFGATVLASILYLGIDLGVRLYRHNEGINTDWNIAFGILTSSACGAKILGQQIATKGNGTPGQAE